MQVGAGVLRFSAVCLEATAGSVHSTCVAPDALDAYAAAEGGQDRPVLWLDAYVDVGGQLCVSVITRERPVTVMGRGLYLTLDELFAEIDARCRAGSVPDVFSSWEQAGDVATFVQFVDAP